jgi:hypothetical protein
LDKFHFQNDEYNANVESMSIDEAITILQKQIDMFYQHEKNSNAFKPRKHLVKAMELLIGNNRKEV